MLDTINFKIHDLEANIRLAEYLNKSLSSSGMSTYVAEDKEEDTTTVRQKINFRRYVKFHDRQNLLETKHFNEIPSSHYTVSYQIDYVQDCISFNLSIPKYNYGSNLLQLIHHYDSKSYQPSIDMVTALDESFDFLKRFFEYFFDQFGNITVTKQHVEISRIDFCYNQVFPSRELALQYLNEQKRIRKKHMFNSSDAMASWASSVSFKSKSHSFKIYHKGVEFRKNDAPKMKKQAKKHGYNISSMQDFADRILRYEATFRGLYLSNVYKRTLFRKNCTIWNRGLKLFDAVKSTGGYILEGKERTPFHELPFDLKKLFFFTENIVNKKFNFYLRSDSDFMESSKPYLHEISNREKNYTFDYRAQYSRALHNELGMKFLEYVNQFKITSKSSLTKEVINILNEATKEEQIRKKLKNITGVKKQSYTPSVKTLRNFFALLEQYTMDEIKDMNFYSMATFYRIKAYLRRFGIENTSNLNFKTIDNFDFIEYHNFVLANSNFIQKKLF